MHKSATKCNETIGKWCKNKHGASKIIDTLETYQWIELIKDYDLGIHYHPGKANVVADALIREPCSLNAMRKTSQPTLCEEFEKFGLELVSHGFLANLEVRPTLFD
jgi:hypothetical protein